MTWNVNALANLIDDFIFLQGVDGNGDGLIDRLNESGELDPAGELVSTAYAQQDAEFYGGEVEGVIGLLQGPGSVLDLRVFADYVRGGLRDGGDLPRITPLRLVAGLDYTLTRWSAGIDVIRIEEQDRVAPLETETDGYTLLDARLSCRLASNGDYEFFVQGANLLNEEARRHTSFLKQSAPLPGRSVTVGLNARF
ncbi:MAG: TonB-dependent receptor [Gammaproteobacteria bacterium]|nr:TonB-dependent receptor [Gammaproteobacteria bacterium]